jgi:hypothetical protein
MPDNEGSYGRGDFLTTSGFKYRSALQNFDVFPKPYAAAELLQKVKDVLNKARG